MNNCVSKPISAFSWVSLPLEGTEMIPVVQNGENKIVQVKDLFCPSGSSNCNDACLAELKCDVSFALELAKRAMQVADTAFKTACANDAKLSALEQLVDQHDTLICEIQRRITDLYNTIEHLKTTLKVSINKRVQSPNNIYDFYQGSEYIDYISVPILTTDLSPNSAGMAADASAVYAAIPERLSQLINDLKYVTFNSGKFTESGTQYNGSTTKTIHVPTRTSHLVNDGDENGNDFLIGLKDYAGNDVPVTSGVADLSRNDLPVATSNKLGAVKLGSDVRAGDGAPLKLNSQNQGIIAPATNDVYGTIKVGATVDGNKYPVTLDGNGRGIVDLSSFSGGVDELNDLDDVTAPNPSAGDILYYDGTKWINSDLATLVNQLIDCQTVIDCIGGTVNFNVAPLEIVLAYNKRNTNGTPFVVTSNGAWIIRKKFGGSEFSADINDNTPQTGDGEFLVTVSSDNNTGDLRQAIWEVIPKVTVPGYIEPIEVVVKQKTSRTIRYVVVGNGTASDVSGLPSGNSAKVNDGANYSRSNILPKSGFEITSVTFSPSTGASYTPSNGKVYISNVTNDVTVIIEINPAVVSQHKVTYIIPDNADKIDISAGDIYVNDGVAYIEDLAGAINDPRYEITNVSINPQANGSYDTNTGEVTVPDTVTTDTEITITIAPKQSGLSASPNPVDVVKNGSQQTKTVTITNTCATNGIVLNRGTLPSGVTATLNSAKTKITLKVPDATPVGSYTFTITNDCGDTETITLNVSASTLTINPNTISTTEGTSSTQNVTATTTCPTNTVQTSGTVPSGITVGTITENVDHTLNIPITVASTVSQGTYTINFVDGCGNTASVTVNVQAQTGNPTVEFILDTSDSNASVTVDGHTITSSQSYTDSSITSGSNYSQVITPASDYEIINVEVIPNGTQYTWDAVDSEVTIPSISNTNYQVYIYIQQNPFGDFDDGHKRLFNALGIIEERLDPYCTSTPVDAGVDDPKDETTYTDAAGSNGYGPIKYYEYEVGTWNDIRNIQVLRNGSPDDVLYYQQEYQHQQLTRNEISRTDYNGTALTEARLAGFTDYLGLEYWKINNHNEPELILTKTAVNQPSDSAYNDKPFYIVVAEKSIYDNLDSDNVDLRRVVFRIYCQPTDFGGISEDVSEAPGSLYYWQGYYRIAWNYKNQYNELIQRIQSPILWDYYDDRWYSHPYGNALVREAYKLSVPPINNSQNSDYSGISYETTMCGSNNSTYIVGEELSIAISSGTDGYGGTDWTSLHNPPVAAFTKTVVNSANLPDYTVELSTNNPSVWTPVTTSVNYRNSRYWLDITGLPGDGDSYFLRFKADAVYVTSVGKRSIDLIDNVSIITCYSGTPSVSVTLNGNAPTGLDIQQHDKGGRNHNDSDYGHLSPTKGTYSYLITLDDPNPTDTLVVEMIANSGTPESITNVMNSGNRDVYLSQDYTNFNNLVYSQNWEQDKQTIRSTCGIVVCRGTRMSFDNNTGEVIIGSEQNIVQIYVPVIKYASVQFNLSYSPQT